MKPKLSKQPLNNSSYPKDKLLPQVDFLKKRGIKGEDYKRASIKWKELEEIHADYLAHIDKLEHAAESIVKTLLTKQAKEAGVHSVRYRIKDAESLIEKIIRKRIKSPKREITKKNYKEEITDLIGVRALHVFKTDFPNIHYFIKEMWKFKPKYKPILYHRKGDSSEFIKLCRQYGCQIAEHPKSYRSIHYIVVSTPTKLECVAEIQVRTIFEEGWSEIDHKMRYHLKNSEEHFLDNYLSILNRIARSADEIGSLIRQRDSEFQKKVYEQKYESKKKK